MSNTPLTLRHFLKAVETLSDEVKAEILDMPVHYYANESSESLTLAMGMGISVNDGKLAVDFDAEKSLVWVNRDGNPGPGIFGFDYFLSPEFIK